MKRKKYTITEAAKHLGISRATVHLPLSHFLDYLKSTKENDRKFPRLNEVEWLLRNFRFDDQLAQYEPEPLPESYTLWWQIYARN
jgi:hypothetical protein